MSISTSMKTIVLATVLSAGTAAAVGMNLVAERSGAAVNDSISINPVAQQTEQPKVEVVFVLDTTSSMSGLIDAAKNNIWSIASSMASADPEPDMRMGLVAFRDRGDDYITRIMDLSQDLDSMYVSLSNFRAQGGERCLLESG